jgi:alpha-beta hydrolase superfamily lysophospholipase
MSDSPYSMRSLAETLHGAGAHVVGLRIPGHGTAPSGLVDVEWQDMAAAVRIAVKHLQGVIGDRPLVLVGYSNGGALAVEYTLAALENDQLRLPDRLVLLSPEIGITKLAALAVWQERLGHLLGLQKLAWNSILPEYDPFKYGSFALNAGKQAHLVTREIRLRIERLGKGKELERFPPTLAFQSVVDATVTAPVLVTGLLDPLPVGGHELVLFDINRIGDIEPILKRDYSAWLDDILSDADKSFAVSLVANESKETDVVVLQQRGQGETKIRTSALDLRWPRDLYSLSHVALPFPPDDPVYGGPDAGESPGIQLGKLALRGERGVLEVSAADMLRLRWNPFHAYIEQRVLGVVAELLGKSVRDEEG